MRHSNHFTSLSLIALALFVGCNSSQDPNSEARTTESLLMHRAESCADLDSALREEARLRLAQQIEQQKGSGGAGNSNGAWASVGGSSSMSTGAARVTGMGGSASFSSSTATSADVATGNPEYSETNTQVAGIDEADIVKTDGQHMYVVRQGELKIARAYPANAMSVVASQTIEGQAREMYVVPNADASTTVVVYSDLEATALYQEAQIPVPKNSSNYYSMTPTIDCWDCSYNNYGIPATKVTVLRLSGGAVAVQKELFYEGSYVSSRRNAGSIRTTLQVPSRAPVIEMYPDAAAEMKAELLALEELRASGRNVADVPSDEIAELVQKKLAEVVVAEAETSIEKITHADWLPRTFVRDAGKLTAATLPCESFYIPAAGSTAAGVTFVSQLDLKALQSNASDVAVLGLADTMYENASKVVLASHYWNYSNTAGDQRSQTLLHQFDVSTPGSIAYQASGMVPGYILNQFAIDEKDGALRIVTTDDGSSNGTWISSAGLHVLKAKGAELSTVGKLDGLAKSERVYSVRYLENKVYIVTFRQTDPLFVIDVADPTAPKLLGELKIPGFSEYMHPLGDHHLLTIGRDADNSGRAGNLALQIFDVSNPMSPTLAHKYAFTAPGSSEAEYNHKAFSFFDQFGLLALPFYGSTWTDMRGYVQQNTLELFDVDIDKGFQYQGALDGNLVLSQAETSGDYYCDLYSSGTIDRGLYIEDTLYAVGQQGIIASSLDAPATALNVLKFNGSGTTVPDYCWQNQGGASSGGEVAQGGVGAVGGAAGMPSTVSAAAGAAMRTNTSGTGVGGSATGAGGAASL